MVNLPKGDHPPKVREATKRPTKRYSQNDATSTMLLSL